MNSRCCSCLSAAGVVLLLGVVFLAGCGGPGQTRNDNRTHAISQADSPSDTLSTERRIVADFPDTAGPFPEKTVEPEQWPGRRFVMLDKAGIFRTYGLYLYTSPEMEQSSAPVDSSIELPNHRLRCEVFANTIVHIDSVRLLENGEYFVVGTTDTLGLPVYATTSNKVIEGLAPASDQRQASERWLGAQIYALRKHINIADSGTGGFRSVPVSVTEPLTVIAVRWGKIPLPPKPIWLIVKRSSGEHGFIPVFFSWTNVPVAKRRDGLPWEDEVLEINPRQRFDWTKEVWEQVDNSRIMHGMTTNQVRLSWGIPDSTRSSHKPDVRMDTWFYPGNKLIFHYDSLIREEKR